MKKGCYQGDVFALRRNAGIVEPPVDLPLSICFHGTSPKNAQKIRNEGFREWTYFAHHLENAVHFGGPHVFEVAFAKADLAGTDWQFRVRRPVLPDRIVAHRIYKSTTLHENEKLRQSILKSNEMRRPVKVDTVMVGKMKSERPPDARRWLFGSRRAHHVVFGAVLFGLHAVLWSGCAFFTAVALVALNGLMRLPPLPLENVVTFGLVFGTMLWVVVYERTR